MDKWAADHPAQRVFMQSGKSNYKPQHCESVAYTQPIEWEGYFNEADLVVSHAGMGTIIKSLDNGKPLIIMPRLAVLGEHRNDHQVATADRFSHFKNVRVVRDADELNMALCNPPVEIQEAKYRICENLDRLVEEIRVFIYP
jgi:UDP-N-acetylglucosamine transferase subunit ALG13